jgi:23S rRNA (cytosine1962-C5)-methyltransferase
VQAASTPLSTSSNATIDRRITDTSFHTLRRPRADGFDHHAAVDDYELLDAGDGARLERFGAFVVDRPQGGADDRRGAPDRWTDADLRFDRPGGWSGRGLAAAHDDWTVHIDDIELELRPTDAGQVGVFPEHAAMLPWLRERITRSRLTGGEAPTVLHLFAYTGLVTLALARSGAGVVHVDAARPAVAWARRNADRNGLGDRPIRWLVDDAPAFVAREHRRGRRYHGVILDPPTYGHGARGETWALDRDLPRLLEDVERVLRPGGFVLVTAHTEGIDPSALGALVGGRSDTGELRLMAASGATLRLGAFARRTGTAS